MIGQPGLKLIDFTADDHFDVGIKICSWVVDKSYTGDVTVVDSNGNSTLENSNRTVYDYSTIDKNISEIVGAIKDATKEINDRMFKQNPVDASINGRSKTYTVDHIYPVYKIGPDEIVQYNKPEPKLYNLRKYVISTSKSFSNSSACVTNSDYDVNHVFVNVNSDQEVTNIESFLFSEYFVNYVRQFKIIDGYGFNNAVKYLPIFDKTKSWTNEEVKDFIESHIK